MLRVDLEDNGFGFASDVQHRIAELIPAGGSLIADVACHPKLMQLLHGYLGPHCRCATFSSNTLLPQGETYSVICGSSSCCMMLYELQTASKIQVLGGTSIILTMTSINRGLHLTSLWVAK